MATIYALVRFWNDPIHRVSLLELPATINLYYSYSYGPCKVQIDLTFGMLIRRNVNISIPTRYLTQGTSLWVICAFFGLVWYLNCRLFQINT